MEPTNDRARARALNDEGNDLAEAGKHDDAGPFYREATVAAPSWDGPWFNLGLFHKRRREWSECARCNETAARLNPENQAAYWNLGIASTALGRWADARRAWLAYGLELPAGEGPIVLNLGPVPIRVDPTGAAEVVWCRRIDPARAVIENVPTPDCGRRFRDLVLHDGAPNGYRKLRSGEEVPVFDELEVLERSKLRTFSAKVEAELPQDVEELLEAFHREDLGAEDWGATVRTLCTACSEGRPHEHHESDKKKKEWSSERELGLAAPDEATARELLETWARARADERTFALEAL